MARTYTYDQVTQEISDQVGGLTAQAAVELAMSRARSRCEEEKPAIEHVAGRGMIIRNYTDFAEVVIYEGEAYVPQDPTPVAAKAA